MEFIRFSLSNLNINYHSLQVEMLNAEKTALTQLPQNDKVLMLAQEKKMALCETCGSFLVANDAAERTQSHVTGKQHIGYGMVRDFITEYKVSLSPKIIFMFKAYISAQVYKYLGFLTFRKLRRRQGKKKG